MAGADVFLQNFAPGAVARLGLDGETLRAADPRLVVVNMSGYGASGPRRDRKAYDMLIQAETGLVSVTGTPETATKTGVPASDIAAGLYATNSVLAALFRRERTGEGATVEVSMFDATAEWLGHQMYMQMYAGRQVPRMGLSHAAIAPYDAYPTSDGQMLIGVQNDRGWQRPGDQGVRPPGPRRPPPAAHQRAAGGEPGGVRRGRRHRDPHLDDGGAGRAAGRGGGAGGAAQRHARAHRAPAAQRPRPVARGRQPGRAGARRSCRR